MRRHIKIVYEGDMISNVNLVKNRTVLIKNLAQKVWTFWQSAILIKIAIVFAPVR